MTRPKLSTYLLPFIGYCLLGLLIVLLTRIYIGRYWISASTTSDWKISRIGSPTGYSFPYGKWVLPYENKGVVFISYDYNISKSSINYWINGELRQEPLPSNIGTLRDGFYPLITFVRGSSDGILYGFQNASNSTISFASFHDKLPYSSYSLPLPPFSDIIVAQDNTIWMTMGDSSADIQFKVVAFRPEASADNMHFHNIYKEHVVSLSASIDIRSTGLPGVSFMNNKQDVYLAEYDGINWTTILVDEGYDEEKKEFRLPTILLYDSADEPIVIYRESSAKQLIMANRRQMHFGKRVIANEVGQTFSAACGKDQVLHIAYEQKSPYEGSIMSSLMYCMVSNNDISNSETIIRGSKKGNYYNDISIINMGEKVYVYYYEYEPHRGEVISIASRVIQ